MPTMRASAKPNMQGWEPSPSAAEKAEKSPDQTPSLPNNQTRSPYMHASMPLMASTNDALAQYYTSDNLPQQRILPARPGGAVT